MESLRGLPSDDPTLPQLVHTLTENFDKFPDVKLDGAAGTGGAGEAATAGMDALCIGHAYACTRAHTHTATAGGRGKSSKSQFVGYTFKRSKDGSGPVLSTGGPAGHTSAAAALLPKRSAPKPTGGEP